jgi:hypothetical protein
VKITFGFLAISIGMEIVSFCGWTAQLEALEGDERAKVQEKIEKNALWVDPRPRLKTQPEWDEVFAEISGYIAGAEGAAAEATKEIAVKEAELAAQIADHGPRRDDWKTAWLHGKLDREKPFPGVPSVPLD